MEMIYQGDGLPYGNKPEKYLPMYGIGMPDSFPANAFKAESGLTLTSNLPISRKRTRDSCSIDPPFAPIVNPNQQQFGAFEFLNEGISSQMYQQQMEIDRFIAHHSEKVRMEIGELRRRNTGRLAAAYEVLMNRLKTKDDEVLKIRRLNRSLEEKAKSISVENQIWRELALTNEATANALRSNLQQVLMQVQMQQQQDGLALAGNCDDAESQCGSNFEEDHDRQVEEDSGVGERKVNDESESKSESRYGRWSRRCRKCGKGESCVLLLPCRHLCVCRLCVSSIHVCPVCNSTKSAGVHVNMI